MILKPLSNIERTTQLTLGTSYTHSTKTLNIQLEGLAQRQQWIMFTAQCPRTYVVSLADSHNYAEKVVHLMPSRQLSEFDVVEKAIRSNNASAVIASSQLSAQQQAWLTTLAKLHHCLLFFVDASQNHLH